MKNKYVETVAQRCSVKKTFLEISQNSQENTCARVPSLIKLQASSCNFIKKEALAQVFSCTFWETPKNSRITSGGCFWLWQISTCYAKLVSFYNKPPWIKIIITCEKSVYKINICGEMFRKSPPSLRPHLALLYCGRRKEN